MCRGLCGIFMRDSLHIHQLGLPQQGSKCRGRPPVLTAGAGFRGKWLLQKQKQKQGRAASL